MSGSAAESAGKTVSLVVDYGDGSEVHFKSLPWRSGMTVLDALESVKSHPHGVEFRARGRGTTALVTKIGDQANEGGAGSSRNWIFRVNGNKGEVGAGAYELKPAEAVLWKFETYEEPPQ